MNVLKDDLTHAWRIGWSAGINSAMTLSDTLYYYHRAWFFGPDVTERDQKCLQQAIRTGWTRGRKVQRAYERYRASDVQELLAAYKTMNRNRR